MVGNVGSKSFIGGALKNFKAMTMASSDGYVVWSDFLPAYEYSRA